MRLRSHSAPILERLTPCYSDSTTFFVFKLFRLWDGCEFPDHFHLVAVGLFLTTVPCGFLTSAELTSSSERKSDSPVFVGTLGEVARAVDE
jgi:hypothetical protein